MTTPMFHLVHADGVSPLLPTSADVAWILIAIIITILAVAFLVFLLRWLRNNSK